jgi:hypothetical protein
MVFRELDLTSGDYIRIVYVMFCKLLLPRGNGKTTLITLQQIRLSLLIYAITNEARCAKQDVSKLKLTDIRHSK